MRLQTKLLWPPVLAAAALLVGACDDAAGPNVTVNYLQEDRFGLPAVATVFIPTAQKDAYNEAAPAGDVANYRDEIYDGLLAFGNSMASANALADALTPDIQPIDVTSGAGFLNGRQLDDDVITAELGLIFGSNAALNDDHVDANDKAFLTTFPYLAAPTTQ